MQLHYMSYSFVNYQSFSRSVELINIIEWWTRAGNDFFIWIWNWDEWKIVVDLSVFYYYGK